MQYQVISPFRDRRSGELVNPGDPLPEGLDPETIGRLRKARCLRPSVAGDTPAPTGTQAAPGSGPGRAQKAAVEGGAAADAEGARESGAYAKAVAGRDGGAGGKRAKPDKG